jgi:DNA replication protein DnaC
MPARAASVAASAVLTTSRECIGNGFVEDRHNRGSTIVTSQLPIDHWHEAIANPTIADAILDRLVHNAHRLTLKGESMRKMAANRARLDTPIGV